LKNKTRRFSYKHKADTTSETLRTNPWEADGACTVSLSFKTLVLSRPPYGQLTPENMKGRYFLAL